MAWTPAYILLLVFFISYIEITGKDLTTRLPSTLSIGNQRDNGSSRPDSSSNSLSRLGSFNLPPQITSNMSPGMRNRFSLIPSSWHQSQGRWRDTDGGLEFDDACPGGVCKPLKKITKEFTIRVPEVIIVLPTAVVKLVGSNGRSTPARILVDTGATKSVISKRMVERLDLDQAHLRSSSTRHELPGREEVAQGKTDVKVCSRYSKFCMDLTVDIIGVLRTSLPVLDPQTVPAEGLELGEDATYEPACPTVDLLLGVDEMEQFLVTNTKRFKGYPLLWETNFGWVAAGKGDPKVSYLLLPPRVPRQIKDE